MLFEEHAKIRNMKTGRTHTRRKKEKQEPAQKPLRYTYSFVVPRSDFLLEFLLRKLSGMSRNSVKSLLSSRKILVNGRPVTQFDYPLAKDDEIKVAKGPVRDLPPLSASTGKKPGKERFKQRIIYEDEVLIAMDKPAGMLSVESDTDRDSAYYRLAEYMKARDARSRPYILHRIDKETSGVLVFAKDIKMHSMLRMHWNEDISLREYYAIVKGTFTKKEGTMTAWLKENENHKVYVSKNRNGKKSVTNYEVVAENKEYSLLRVTIDTGRKNQIRVVMAAHGHPVVGDEKYGDGSNPIGRLGLHASALAFMNPSTREKVMIKAAVPKIFWNYFSKEGKCGGA